MHNDLTVVIPAYNEEIAIGGVIEELSGVLLETNLTAEILVVDDGSADATAKAALDAGARVLRHRSNRGYGAALKTGILAATNSIVAIVDADGTYPLNRLPHMIHSLSEADMVVGARTGPNVHIPLVRKPAKWILNCMANYVSGTKIPDLNSGLRIFRREVALQYFPILPDQFSWTTTITLAMLCDKYAVTYVPIDYRERKGRSKIVAWDAGTFTMLILRMAILFRPLRVFLPIAIVCFTYGIAKMVVDVVRDPMISASAVLMLMSALVTLLMGMIAEAIATRMGRGAPNTMVSTRTDELLEAESTPAPSLDSDEVPARTRH